MAKPGNSGADEACQMQMATPCDSTDMKCPEQVNPQGQKQTEWWPGAGGGDNGERLPTGTGFLSWGG